MGLIALITSTGNANSTWLHLVQFHALSVPVPHIALSIVLLTKLSCPQHAFLIFTIAQYISCTPCTIGNTPCSVSNVPFILVVAWATKWLPGLQTGYYIFSKPLRLFSKY